MTCAVADLPAPRLMTGPRTTPSFIALPVNINVLETESGSCSKPRTACCAAAYALVVLTLRSFSKSARGRENVCLGSLRVAA
jgi:hypothetical protein